MNKMLVQIRNYFIFILSEVQQNMFQCMEI